MKNSWLEKQRETRSPRPKGLCGPLSFVTQRDYFAYVNTDRSRIDLSTPQRCGYMCDCHIAVVILVLTKSVQNNIVGVSACFQKDFQHDEKQVHHLSPLSVKHQNNNKSINM